MSADVADTGRAVAVEKKTQDAADEMIVRFASIDILDRASSTGAVTHFMATFTDSTPCCLLIGMASWAFSFSESPARPAIESASSYQLHTTDRRFH